MESVQVQFSFGVSCHYCVNSGVVGSLILSLSLTFGKKSLLIALFVVVFHLFCHCSNTFSFSSNIIADFGFLWNTASPSSSAASFAFLSASSLPVIPTWALIQLKWISQLFCLRYFIVVKMLSIMELCLWLSFSRSNVILLSEYTATVFSSSFISLSDRISYRPFHIASCSAWLFEHFPSSLYFKHRIKFLFWNITAAAPTFCPVLLPSVYI